MKHPLFDQAASLAAANGHISISLVQRALSVPLRDAADVVDELHRAGIVGEYDSTDCRPFIGSVARLFPAVQSRRDAWLKARAEIIEKLGMNPDPARAWWIAMNRETRAEVMRAAVVPVRHIGAAWDELPNSAREKLRVQHDRRRRWFVRLQAEFAGRVAA
jgi:hypothetical protein